MRDFIMILSVAGAFVFCYFVVDHFGKAAEESRKARYRRRYTVKRKKIIISGDASDNEIIKKVHEFKEENNDITLIITYTSEQDEDNESE